MLYILTTYLTHLSKDKINLMIQIAYSNVILEYTAIFMITTKNKLFSFFTSLSQCEEYLFN